MKNEISCKFDVGIIKETNLNILVLGRNETTLLHEDSGATVKSSALQLCAAFLGSSDVYIVICSVIPIFAIFYIIAFSWMDIKDK